ncbi:MAG: exodeoxyribonuclease VII small subunit [Candidatus Cloacimonadaceae bacterium]|jgi:exodeoxyribonuclease VII small subunit|nr:exodeoxyribonuclease VII small subunit [Candidatus Cloacimonadota bacterium]MCK9178198.1 exodeoxyribonuclease VII small subunit [Candidatus Cloacimonadota bacterium]MDD3103645.1 exodeoxyribonuclease VII small subunit [Candidatus Cloacimonadota bacterium]MDD3533346.1 exodeoxyribonuclease VII small subunit [Candidatus Cloacimonadota bacterium]MDY0127830.1 exodeoxyribonuclease VII small subunit [Candidatus Cloacimonadaceae bacterium]
MNEKKVEELSFEEALQALEDTVDQLSDSSTTLDQTLILYSEGVKYLNRCRAKLTEVEAKIKLISEGLPPRPEADDANLAQEDDNGH